jgi:tetratricopeptide (TPR) repeat protein
MPHQLTPADLERCLDRGVELFNRGKEGASRGWFTRAIEASPLDPRGYYFRAVASRSIGREADAAEDLTALSRLKPCAAETRLRAAELLLELRLADRARGEIRAALRLGGRESRADSWLALARLEGKVGRSGESRRCLVRALAAAPAGPMRRAAAARLLEVLGDYAGAEKLLRPCEKGAEAFSAGGLELARLRLWRGDASSACRLAERALREEAWPAGAAHRTLGAARVLEGRLEAAVRELDLALAAVPHDAEARIWRGEAQRRLGNLAAARADLLEAERLAPLHLGLLLNLELLDLAEGRQAPADKRLYVQSRVPAEVSRMRRAFEAGPADAAAAAEGALKALGGNRSASPTFVMRGKLADQVHFFPRDRLVELQSALRFGDAASVLSEFDRLAKLHPNEAYVYSHRGEVKLWLGRWAAAREDFERALKLNGELLWPKIGLGAALLFEGRVEEALRRFELASDRTSDSIVCPWRGEALRLLGRPKEALREFDKLKEPLPFRPSAWLQRAMLAGTLGRRAEAERILRRLERHAPDFLSEAGSAGGTQAVLQRALEMMRGNRSRWMYTYFRAGGLRALRFRGIDPASVPLDQRSHTWQWYGER